jgi:alpha-beta hydrolase superfamily lysophospholipase
MLQALLLAVLLVAGTACAPVVMPAGPPSAMPSLRENAIVTSDGVALPLRRFAPPGEARAVLLALHGFNDHAGNFLVDSLERFNAAGLLIYAYDQRGFGRAPNRGYWPGAETLAADAAEAAQVLRRRHPDLPFFLLGESMGAAVSVLAGTRAAAPPVDGYILLAPALWSREAMNPFMRGGLWLAARTIPMMGFQGGVGGIVASDNVDALRRLGRDPLTIRTTRVDAAIGLVDLMDAAVAALPGCCRGATGDRAPVLALIGAQDMIVPARATRHALRPLPETTRPRIAVYPQGFHLLLSDRNREEVADDILAFIAAPAGPLPSGADANAPAWLEGRATPGS